MTRKALMSDPTEVPIIGTHLSDVTVSVSASFPADVKHVVFAIRQPEDMEFGGALEGATAELEKYQADIDAKYGAGGITQKMKASQYTGGYKKMESVTLIGASLAAAAVVSLGLTDEAHTYGYKGVGRTIVQYLKQEKCGSACISLPSGFSVDAAAGILGGVYTELCPSHQVKYSKAKLEEPTLKKLVFVAPGMDEAMFLQMAALTKMLTDAQYFAAELVIAPPNYCNPTTLAKALREMAASSGLKCVEVDEEQLIRMKAGGILAVGRGSIYPPSLVRVTYEPEGATASTPTIAFVGKGITMDTGGYNVKVDYLSHGKMKADMGGAAAVMGAAKAIAALKPRHLRVHFIACIAENMIDKHAYRCGDVLTMLDGTKVEVGNTDAEGRLVLADGMTYAATLPEKEGKPESIMTVATLTGASFFSMGSLYASMFTRHHTLRRDLMEASEMTGDLVYPGPMIKEYEHERETSCGDVSSIHNVPGHGHIMATLFLKSFCPKQMAYAHIDMAGQATDQKNIATGFGPKLLAAFVMKIDGRLAEGATLKKMFGKADVSRVIKLE